MNIIREILSDKNNRLSGTNIAKLFIVFSVMIIWIINSIKNCTISEMPSELVYLIIGCLGVGVANKGIDVFKKDK